MHVPTILPSGSVSHVYDPGSQPTEHASFASHHASIIVRIRVPVPGRHLVSMAERMSKQVDKKYGYRHNPSFCTPPAIVKKIACHFSRVHNCAASAPDRECLKGNPRGKTRTGVAFRRVAKCFRCGCSTFGGGQGNCSQRLLDPSKPLTSRPPLPEAGRGGVIDGQRGGGSIRNPTECSHFRQE